MAGYWSASDVERLPWLEPYRERRARRSAPVAARKRDAGMLVGGMAAIALAVTAGYHIGQRDPRVAAPLEEVALAPVSTAPLAPIVSPPIVETLPPAPATIVTAATSQAEEGQREVRTAPGPAGQVIQLGAFRTPSGAGRAYRTWLARYPVLGAMPHVVVPMVSKSRGQILYVLRLGTTSRQQSRTVCSDLRASGDECLVIG